MTGINATTTTTTTSSIMSINDGDVVVANAITHGQGLAHEQGLGKGLGQDKTARSSLNMFSLQHVRSQPLSDVIPPPSPSSSSFGGGYQQQGYHRVIQEENRNL